MAAEQLGELVAMQHQPLGQPVAFLQSLLIDRVDECQAGSEQAGAERFRHGGAVAAALSEEEFQVLAAVEDPEAPLIASGSEEVLAGAGALPTLCQYLVRERTGWKNARLTISGMSMPVSSMSTERVSSGARHGRRRHR